MADRPSDLRLQRFSEFLAQSGLKATRQREQIVRAFFAAGRHISAEELYHRIREQDPGIGLVTVYRTLKLLRSAGLATQRKFGDDYARFDPHPADWPHHHLICTRCGKIQEFQDTTLNALRRKVARSVGFTVTEHRIELYGFCRACARLRSGRPAANGKAARTA
jgi:Fur family transcriptional regulator, ferric uptake regulator